MIKNKIELKFYILADEIMNSDSFPQKWWEKILMPSKVQLYLRYLRKLEYINSQPLTPIHFINILMKCFYKYRLYKLSYETGLQIPTSVLGYGCRIGHWGSIVVNGNGHIGNYCCLHNLVTFADGNYKEIGDRCFIGTGVTFAKNVVIGNDCKISANSFVNKTFNENNLLIGGVPASKICYTDSWIKDYRKRWEQCENLKKEMHLEYL